ncbi:acetate kinase [mine drainage metagenome]|uniref:Acetate kinase n=1 Tax=mine drainage metagenome TaxID=410659 RepID=A0A1J5TBS0_9ZZZZ
MDTFSILALNTGNSFLKFSLFQRSIDAPINPTIKGCISDIGGASTLTWTYGTIHAHIGIAVNNHNEAAEWAFDWLQNLWPLGSLLDNVNVVEHRFVDYGKRYNAPVIVDENVITQLEAFIPHAIPHNTKAIMILIASQKLLAKKALTVVTFDTALIHDIDEPTTELDEIRH